MKTAEEYAIEAINGESPDVIYGNFVKAIIQAQKDAYNKALEDAAENIDQNTIIYTDLGVAESIRIEIRKLKKQ